MFKFYKLNASIEHAVEKSKDILKYAVKREPVKARLSVVKNGRNPIVTNLIRLKVFEEEKIMAMKAEFIRKTRLVQEDRAVARILFRRGSRDLLATSFLF